MAVIDNNIIDYSYLGEIYNLFSQLSPGNILLTLIGSYDSTFYDVNNLYLDNNYYISIVTSLTTGVSEQLVSYGLENYKLPKISAGSFTSETSAQYQWNFLVSSDDVVIDGDFIAKTLDGNSLYRFDNILRIAIFINKPED